MWKWEAEGQAKGVIVFVHSAYEHHLRYAWQIAQWRSANFHVIMTDLPGHGKDANHNQPHDKHFSEYEKAVGLMIKTAQKLELPVIVLGHGLGATIAMNVLGRAPLKVTAAIFTSPWLQLIKTPSKVPNALTGLYKLAGNKKIDHNIQIQHVTRNREVIEQEENDELYQPVVTAGWYRELLVYMKQTAANTVGFPKLPVLVMTGERDMITNKGAAKMWLQQQQLKEFSYKEWPHCYHDLFQEPERDDLFSMALSFIRNVLRPHEYTAEERGK